MSYGTPSVVSKPSARLPANLAVFAHERATTVLQQLSLPLELRKFFDALPGIDRGELARNPAAALTTAVEQAHRDSIEQTVVEQIEARDAIKPAAIVWALIKPYGRLSIDVLRGLEDALVDGDSSLEDKRSVHWSTASSPRVTCDRDPMDRSPTITPRVEAGLETSLARHPQPVRRTLRLLVDALLARDDEAGGNWGIETAAEIIRLSDRIPDARPQIGRSSQDRIDAWIEQTLTSEERELDSALILAAAVGSPRSNLAELSRWLGNRPDRTFPGMMHWGRPLRDEEWHARLRADLAVRTAAERFMKCVRPGHRSDPLSGHVRFRPRQSRGRSDHGFSGRRHSSGRLRLLSQRRGDSGRSVGRSRRIRSSCRRGGRRTSADGSLTRKCRSRTSPDYQRRRNQRGLCRAPLRTTTERRRSAFLKPM